MKMILVVDDDAQSRKLLALMVKDCGCQPILVSSAESAYEIFVENPDIRMVFTDYLMKQKSGLGLLSSIRTFEKSLGKRTPVVVVSSYVKTTQEQEILDLGGDGFMCKPLNKKIVKEYISEYLGELNGFDK